MELALLVLLFASSVSSVMAVRYYNHAGLVGSMPVEFDARKNWTAAGTAYLRIASVLYSSGLHQLVLISPVLALILHPVAAPTAAFIVCGVLFSFDTFLLMFLETNQIPQLYFHFVRLLRWIYRRC